MNCETRIRIPEGTTKVVFPDYFNDKVYVGDIPSSVTHLTFGHYFDQELEEGVIPSSVTDLTFGYCFNKVLKKGVIPSSVTYLAFGEYKKKLEDGVIPQSVTELYIHDKSNCLRISDYDKVNIYHYGNNQKFDLEIPETHTASELKNSILHNGSEITVMEVKRRKHSYMDNRKRLRENNNLPKITGYSEGSYYKQTYYEPTDIDFSGELTNPNKNAFNEFFTDFSRYDREG